MNDGFVLRAADSDAAVVSVAESLHMLFGHGRDYILNHPDILRPHAVRYVEHEGAVVAAHVIETMELSLGETWVRAGRIELVGTAPDFRRQGLCRRLMEDSFAYLKSEGVSLALIFGYPLFGKMGFEHCIPTYEQSMPDYSPPGSAVIPTRALAGSECSRPLRPMCIEDIPQVAGVHRGGNPAGNLSRRRSLDCWQHLVRQQGIDTYWVCESGGSVAGYVRVVSEGGSVQAREAVAADEASCNAILGHLHEVATANAAESVVFFCPHCGTMGQHLRGRGAAECAPDAQRETSLQMVVLDLGSCFRGLEGTFARRVQRSELCGARRRYRILTEHDGVGLELRDGEVTVCDAGGDGEVIRVAGKRMARLLAGFGPCEAGAHRLLEVLFPAGEPYWYVDDL